MISRIEGQLLTVCEGCAELLLSDNLTFELLVPGADEQQLATCVGRTVSFHTLLYLESQGQGTSFFPRLIGFNSVEQRDFFELFTKVKGIGYRKALRAMQLPFGMIAAAIASRDTTLLVSLPEIGRRTAETIVAELHGKVDRFVEIKPAAASAADSTARRIAMDAVAALVQLGEQRLIAAQLIDRALAADPTLKSADALVAAAFRLKELA